MVVSKEHDDDIFWMSGSYTLDKLQIRRAIVKEKLGALTEVRIEFQSSKTNVEIEDLLGKTMSLHLETTSELERKFHGTCVSVENLGLFDGYMQLVAEVRPWPWFLTRVRDNRIFQEKSAKEIIEEVFKDHGFSDFEFKATDTLKKRTYCVQYKETDFDFISRLMEEEGLYYWFDHSGDREQMMIVDGRSGHSPLEKDAKATYKPRSDSTTGEYVAEFTKQRAVRTGKVTLDDYHFVTPKADLQVVQNQNTPSKHNHKSYEIYDYPGRYRAPDKGDTDLGKKYAMVWQEAEDTVAVQYRGAGNLPRIATGRTFTLEEHETKEFNKEYLVTEAVHYIQTQSDYEQQTNRRDLALGPDPFPEEMQGEVYNCTFGTVLAADPYRSERLTPWPKIPGLQTALVVGKAGEEIWTDEHGRIKVQFHWDRVGKKDEKTTCWVRVVTPWSGKNWGMIHIPRIGQEVVIQFEDGNPDRPICTGMLYNKDTMPPYTLPANQTQSGIKTNSSKGGGGFNELMFEDKKGEELVRFQAEKDYIGLTKNHSTVTIGHPETQNEASGDGDLHQTVKNNVVETINDGDRTFTIETGSEIVEIQTDKTVTIHNDKSETIDNNNTRDVGADDTHTIGGSQTTNVASNIATTAGQNIKIEAGAEIELKVGPSSIKITPQSIDIKSPMINIDASTMATMKSNLTTVKADSLLTLKGGLTMIN